MKAYDLQGQVLGEVKLPAQFNEPVRTDLIKRAVLSIQSNNRQPYGSDPRAGNKYASKLSRRRRALKTSYGRNLARSPRKTLMRRGTQYIFSGATAPNTPGGRRAHPPKVSKIFSQKINKKERQKAIRSAISATNIPMLLKQRGFKAESLIVRDLERITKTKELKQLLLKLNLSEDLQRSIIKRIRAGIGKLRGRKYKKTKGPLIVVADNKSVLIKASRNLQGFDVAPVSSLNAELLAPGAVPGRLTIWSEAAIEKLEKEKLFLL